MVVDGQTIGTTSEHPFWVVGRGWIPAGMLEGGARVLAEDGRTLTVESSRDAGRVETVYNFRVADDHLPVPKIKLRRKRTGDRPMNSEMIRLIDDCGGQTILRQPRILRSMLRSSSMRARNVRDVCFYAVFSRRFAAVRFQQSAQALATTNIADPNRLFRIVNARRLNDRCQRALKPSHI